MKSKVSVVKIHNWQISLFAASGVSPKLVVLRMFDLWPFAAGILNLLCTLLVVIEVINSTERQNVIVCVVLSMVLMQLFDKAVFY